MWRTTAPLATLAALCACLAACGSAAPVMAPTPDPPPLELPTRPDDTVPEYERRLHARAAALERQGRFAEAAFAWEVLALLHPEHGERLTELNQRIESLAAERLQRARQAQARGDVATAEQVYLSVLALQPDHAEAAASLRAIERARTQRTLGQPSRTILVRRGLPNPSPKPAESAPTAGDSLELEQVSMLASQGELDDAIGVLERRLATRPRDDSARRLLANLHFQRAQTLRTNNPGAARAALANCLRFEPEHAEAAALLKQLAPLATKPPATRAKPVPRGEDPR